MKYMFRLVILISLLSVSLSASNKTNLRISADELIANINYIKTFNNINAIVLIDTRSEDLYNRGHIKNALNFPAVKTFENINLNGRLVNKTKFEQIARNLGLEKDSAIVIYDNGTFSDSSRLFWALEVYGFSNVKLLSNSYSYWDLKHYPISKRSRNIMPSEFIAVVDKTKLATKFSTQKATKNEDQIIVDARSQIAYTGKISSAIRRGHIPKAVNLPATNNIKKLANGTTVLYDIETLEDIYEDIDKNKKIIIYCEIGKLSSTNYFVMRELGFDVSNYDSSWKEWGNEFYLPITKYQKKM